MVGALHLFFRIPKHRAAALLPLIEGLCMHPGKADAVVSKDSVLQSSPLFMSVLSYGRLTHLNSTHIYTPENDEHLVFI